MAEMEAQSRSLRSKEVKCQHYNRKHGRCGKPENDPIHHDEETYVYYHQFVPATPVELRTKEEM